MKHIGKLFAYLLLSVNALFVGILILTAYSPYLRPDTHSIASCLGLAFPIFLLINLCFLLFWLAVHYQYAALPLIGLLVCLPSIRTYMPVNRQVKSIPEESIKVLSYNVMTFADMKKEEGKNPILEYIRKSDADIVCMQEYATSEKARIHINEKDIRKALEAYPYRDVRRVGQGGGGNRLACYSKYPILSARAVDYKSDYNGSVVYELKIGKDTVTLINNHLESNKLTKEDKVVYESMLKDPKASKMKRGIRHLVGKLAEASAIRSVQAEAIAKEIAASRHPYIIVCGDFNDASISYAHRVIAQELDDAFTQSGLGLGISYNQNKFYFRIDNILISKNLKAYNCTVDRSIKDSDHYPIWCYLTKR